MIITFADRNLKKIANDNKLAIKKMGAKRAKLYQKRLDDMATAESFADFEFLPGRFHQLNGNFKDKRTFRKLKTKRTRVLHFRKLKRKLQMQPRT